ncbi:hypothetical protein ACLOJK_033493 [Asimina triloba]
MYAHLHLRRPATHDHHAVQQLTPITWASHDRARMVLPSRSIQRSHEPTADLPPLPPEPSTNPSSTIRCPRSRASRPHPPPELDGHDPAPSPSSAAARRTRQIDAVAQSSSARFRPRSHQPLPLARAASGVPVQQSPPSTPARSGTTAATPLQPTVSAQIWPWPDPAIAARIPLNDTRRTPTASHRQPPRPPAPPLADAHVPASDQRPAAALHRRRKIQPPYSVHGPPDIRIQIATASQPIAPSLIHDPTSSPPSIGVSSPQARHRAQQATAAARRLPPDSSPRATVHDATNHPDLTASNPTPLSPPPAPPTCKPQQKHFHLTPIHIQNAIT